MIKRLIVMCLTQKVAMQNDIMSLIRTV